MTRVVHWRAASAWGLDRDPADHFTRHAPCGDGRLPDWWTSAETADLSKALHQCLHHCPVLAKCRDWVQTYPDMASGIVAAGRWWPESRYMGGRVRGHVRAQPRRACRQCVPPAKGSVAAQGEQIAAMARQGRSLADIAETVGCSRRYVTVLLRRHRQATS